MTEKIAVNSTGRGVLIAASLVILVAGMKLSASLMVPFLMAAFIAVIAAPPVFWLQRKKVPDALSVLLVVAVIFGAELLILGLVGTSIDDFSANMPTYQQRLRQESAALLELVSRTGLTLPDKQLVEYIDPSAAMALVENLLRALGGMLTNTFLIMLTVIFMLMEASGFPRKLRVAFGEKGASPERLRLFTDGLKRYMAIKTTVSLGTGVAVWAWLTFLGVDFPLLWGVFAFFFNFIPNIGSIFAAIPAVLLAFIQFGVGTMLLVILGYVVVNVVVGNVIEPRYMGRGLGLSTLVVFLSLAFWGWVFGPVGMLLSVPLTMVLRIALESSDRTRWAAILLGPCGAAALEQSPPQSEESPRQPGK